MISEGNIIFVNESPLEVAQACNGLSMMMSLAATVAAAVLLVPMSPWKRVVAALSAAPIALICNIIRITATAWCYHLYGPKVGGPFAHDLAGWLMMPAALILVAIEMSLLSWMFMEEDIIMEPMLLGKAISKGREPDVRQAGKRGKPADGVPHRIDWTEFTAGIVEEYRCGSAGLGLGFAALENHEGGGGRNRDWDDPGEASVLFHHGEHPLRDALGSAAKPESDQ